MRSANVDTVRTDEEEEKEEDEEEMMNSSTNETSDADIALFEVAQDGVAEEDADIA